MSERRTKPKQTPDVTVILPIYNASPFLRECLDSVAAQTLENIEVLCVNDGSTDDSLSIMREYEAADARFRVIDKPNGGYGHSVNRGLSEARGEYVAVLEPDDFVEASMYEDLIAASFLADGPRAQIVKSSYWEYYDFGDGRPYVKAPNLMNCMPKEEFEFTVTSHWEVLYHHPSIWSAIYQRDFIEEKGIRLIEPKGAGWADNPFFFETMLQASSIVWVPAAYYYYRQTNPEASSNLKDFHLPFDRLRDLRGVLERLNVTDPHILVCFYNREFSYIGTVINEVGFPEADSEVYSLIKETLASMDRSVLYGAKRGIHKEFLAYYEDVMGIKSHEIHNHHEVADPKFSIVIGMRNARAALWRTLNSVVRSSFHELEVICVNCSSKDRSASIVREFSNKDGRVKLLETSYTSITDGYNAGLEHARGTYVMFIEPGMELPEDMLSNLSSGLLTCGDVDLAVFGKKLSLLQREGLFEGVEPGPARVECASCRTELFLVTGRSMIDSRLFRTAFLRERGLSFSSGEPASAPLFCLKATWAAQSAAAIPGTGVDDKHFRLSEEIRTTCTGRLVREHSFLNAMHAFACESDDEEMLRAFRNYVCIHLAEDLRKYASCNDAKEAFEQIVAIFRDEYGLSSRSGRYYLSQAAYQRLLNISMLSFEDMLKRDLWGARQHAQGLDRRVKRLKESRSYQLGNAVIRPIKRLVKGR